MLRPNEEESIMALVPRNDKDRIFVIKHPKADPMDYDCVWEEWLKGWLR